MTESEIVQYTQTLRLHLLDMCRVSQRSVDYAIKSLQHRISDFYTSIFDRTCEMDLLHHDVGELARNLMLRGPSSDWGMRFVMASIRICDALQVIHKSALEIAEASLFHLENDDEVDCPELARMGDLANRLMRLCTVALFEEEIVHAKAAVRTAPGARILPTTFCDWYRWIDLRSPSQATYALSISDRLDQLIWHLREMARAIVFWLDDGEHDPSSETDGFHFADCFVTGFDTTLHLLQ